jgi:hypothetical protein
MIGPIVGFIIFVGIGCTVIVFTTLVASGKIRIAALFGMRQQKSYVKIYYPKKMWLKLKNDSKPRKCDKVEVRKFDTANPEYNFRYIGPGNTYEFAPCYKDEWEAVKDDGIIADEATTIEISEGGFGNKDKTTIRDLTEDNKRLAQRVRVLARKLGLDAEDEVAKAQRAKAEQRAIDTAGSMLGIRPGSDMSDENGNPRSKR